MSGVPAPTFPITKPFAADAIDPDYVTLPIPVPSQTGTLVGAASFDDGFPPATMSDPETEGGVPPFGQDMNGILYMITQYAALAQAGQIVPFNGDAAYELGGYKVGAKVASVSVPGRVWTNWLDGNDVDPDSDSTGWASSDPLRAEDAPLAGTYDDVVLPGPSDFILDVDCSDGDVTYTGFIPQSLGQKLTICHVNGENLINLATLIGSAANHQIRGIADGLTLVQGQTATIQYIDDISKWVFV